MSCCCFKTISFAFHSIYFVVVIINISGNILIIISTGTEPVAVALNIIEVIAFYFIIVIFKRMAFSLLYCYSKSGRYSFILLAVER